MQDIENLQWSSLNNLSFKEGYKLVKNKFLNKFSTKLNGEIVAFFDYMDEVWINSTENQWYEGANPWHLGNNQGLEGKNQDIKMNYTFRRRLGIGELMNSMALMVKEWSEEDTKLLYNDRLSALEGEKDSLALKTDGYQFLQKNKKNIIRIANTKGKYIVAEDEQFQLGKADCLWAVTSSKGAKSNKSLKERAFERFSHRKDPTSLKDFDEYLEVRSSCWILEERNGDFYCDCPVSMKGKLCKHTVCMLYHTGALSATDDVKSLPLNGKRRRGRPKKLPHSLVRSPVRQQQENHDNSLIEEEDIDHDIPIHSVEDDIEIEAPFIEEVSQKRKRSCSVDTNSIVENILELEPGLGNSKPPIKKARAQKEVNTVTSSLPPELKCKKRKTTCGHEVVFDKHYNKKLFALYKKRVKSLRSNVIIDPNYIS